MERKKRLPLGIEHFRRIRSENFYYVDKTGLIRDILDNLSTVSLFTRPRRFGKTLAMSMLKSFFEVGTDTSLFDGLAISKERELCDAYMGKYPVISITLKGAEGRSFAEARGMLRWLIGTEAERFEFLRQSERLTELERRQYEEIIRKDEKGVFLMEGETLKNSLRTLSQLLHRHCGKRSIILIDEYDVPLEKAYQSDFYDDMVDLIRGVFGSALKTNESLEFSVVTGCLRVLKESIFTGLNNFSVYTVSDVQYNEYFGFTDAEVTEMLTYYGLMEKYEEVRAWYDGYHFGALDIYCPWDVVSYCHTLKMCPGAKPQNYWVNTSGNDIVRHFIGRANATMRDEIERLIDGGSVWKMIREELTYRDMDSDTDHLWSILFTTGYLTGRGEPDGDLTELVIPNREVRWVFVRQIREWFQSESVKDRSRLERFCRAFQENDAASVEKLFGEYLRSTISIRDTGARNERKESFYHGILLGLLAYEDSWVVRSNAESGDGYCDISVEIPEKAIGIVVELKYAKNGSFDAACEAAMAQIERKGYEKRLVQDGMKTIYRFGIACCKKQCRAVSSAVSGTI